MNRVTARKSRDELPLASSKIGDVINKAKSEIASLGWKWSEEPGYPPNAHLIHLELTRGDERKGWGLFEPLYCWTEAYEKITGKSWQTLIV